MTEDKGRAAVLTEASLLMAVLFLGTNPVAVKLAVLNVPPLPFVGANRVLVYHYLITLVGVVSGVALLGEGLTINKILGGAVILFGVYLARRQ
ncbi:MAG: hypothetical protein M3122_10460 [Actinomycetota bacterium]|nr:hypothetical protein [Actinomycetota bacterium]